MKKSASKFSNYKEPYLSPFEKLFNIFKELIIHTSGDFDEAIDWLRELDKEYILTDENYTIDDFINKELIHFSNADTSRSIGSCIDGLKTSQRKILYSCFKRKLYFSLQIFFLIFLKS